MKVLVTGANGYLGAGVVSRLAEKGIEIIATDIKISETSKTYKTIESDIFAVDNPYDYFGKPDVVLHLAWRDGFVHNSMSHLDDLPKHFHFIEKLVNSGIKKVVVLGSMHEVGFHEGSIDEFTETRPLSFYGIAKNALRQSVELLISKKDTKLQWIRGYYIVNDSEKGNSIFSKIIQASKKGEKKFPFTSGINQYDFLDYNDFCDQIVAVVMNNTVLGIINACSGRPESLASRVERFIRENNLDICLDYGAYPDRPYDSLAIWGNNEKIQRILSECND